MPVPASDADNGRSMVDAPSTPALSPSRRIARLAWFEVAHQKTVLDLIRNAGRDTGHGLWR